MLFAPTPSTPSFPCPHRPPHPKRAHSELAAAIGDAQAVICCTGYKGINPAGFGQVDEEVRRRWVAGFKGSRVVGLCAGLVGWWVAGWV